MCRRGCHCWSRAFAPLPSPPHAHVQTLSLLYTPPSRYVRTSPPPRLSCEENDVCRAAYIVAPASIATLVRPADTFCMERVRTLAAHHRVQRCTCCEHHTGLCMHTNILLVEVRARAMLAGGGPSSSGLQPMARSLLAGVTPAQDKRGWKEAPRRSHSTSSRFVLEGGRGGHAAGINPPGLFLQAYYALFIRK